MLSSIFLARSPPALVLCKKRVPPRVSRRVAGWLYQGPTPGSGLEPHESAVSWREGLPELLFSEAEGGLAEQEFLAGSLEVGGL